MHQRLLAAVVEAGEQLVLGVEQLGAYQLEPFAPQTAPVDALLALECDLEVPAPVRDREIFGGLHAALQQFLPVDFHRQFLVIVLLVVLPDFVVEEVLFVLERFRATHVFEEELRESGGDHVPLFGY